MVPDRMGKADCARVPDAAVLLGALDSHDDLFDLAPNTKSGDTGTAGSAQPRNDIPTAKHADRDANHCNDPHDVAEKRSMNSRRSRGADDIHPDQALATRSMGP
jgi:hypothetical protein